MNIPPIMILALALVVGFVLYALIKRSWSVPAKPGKPSPKKTEDTPADNPEKAAALDKFKAAHAAARDKRKQLQKTVTEDPGRATKAIRSMMKR